MSQELPAIEPDYTELCGVEAVVYEPVKDRVWIEKLLQKADWLWWFEDPNITSLQDALEPATQPPMADGVNNWVEGDEGELGVFKCRAVRFELKPCFSPSYVEHHGGSGPVSEMDTVVINGQGFASLMFDGDETESLKRMATLALERHSEFSLCSPFIGLFNVWVNEYRDEDGGLDSVDVAAEFVREVQLSELEVKV